MQQFASIVAETHEDPAIDLSTAALAIARTEYPHLDAGHYLTRLHDMAQRVTSRMRKNPTARESIALLNQVLFDEEGLRGNREDFYDPRNSFLNDVLDRKLGIPITLSVIYMDVAQRVGFPVAGVSMPGHFLMKHYDLVSGEIFIDAFNRGAVLRADECQQRLREVYGGNADMRPEFLQPTSRREILIRMLNNLLQIYVKQQNDGKNLVILDLLIAIPSSPPELLRERALVRLNLEQYLGAARDLSHYLKLRPEAADREAVGETLELLRKLLGRLN